MKINFIRGNSVNYGFSETVLQDDNGTISFPEVDDKIKLNYLNGQMFNIDFNEIEVLKPVTNYEDLTHKPQINSIELVGNVSASDLGLGRVYYDTKANWDAQRDLVAEQAAIYIYSDATTVTDEYGNEIPVSSIKIGDGTSYLIDMPFLTGGSSQIIMDHLSNNAIHVSESDRELWNNKVTAYLLEDDIENLVLSKVDYVVDSDVKEN